MKRKALGKGLDSLIPRPISTATSGTTDSIATGAGVSTGPSRDRIDMLDVDQIRPNPRQPRESFDDESLDTLAASLRQQGMLQPILVRSWGNGKFELVAGERRWRAAQRAGLLKVPAIVRDIPDARLLEYALIENIQRQELNAIEEARAYRTLIDELGLSQVQVAERVGRQRSTIANSLRLLTLPPAVQDHVRSGVLSMGHARALAGISDPATQVSLADRARAEGMSVRQVEVAVARASRENKTRTPETAAVRDPNVAAAEETLQRALGTKVRIVQGPKGGRVEIYYFGDEELMRVYDLLRGSSRNRG